uniref:Uncharacterized protein n=1 Tax=Arundo donax TaxID=35708 RepID=A0A0A9FB36_ARUDO
MRCNLCKYFSRIRHKWR